MRIAIVIPVFNEEENIEKLLKKISPYPKEDIVVVDDGSQDQTVSIVERFGATLLTHTVNQGKGMAHRTAFSYALKNGYDGVITLDGDGQHAPEEIGNFLEAVDSADILVGTRSMSLSNMPLLRYLTNKVTSLTVSLIASQRILDSQSGYRYISRDVLSAVPLHTSRFQTESEILIKAGRMGFKIGIVPISTIYRQERSYINPFIDTGRFIGLAARSLFE
jgi:glycosyltransferase involved in cell wall biosynthesis